MSTLNVTIEELEGSSPIRLVISGGALPETKSSTYSSELHGGLNLGIGSDVATQSGTAIGYGDTEMSIFLEVPFIGPGDFLATNTAAPKTPEEAFDLFRLILGRSRQCQVSIGQIVRIGLLRNVSATLGRGYGLDFRSLTTPPGMNLEVKLKWQWSSAGEKTKQVGTLAGGDFAGKLSDVAGKLPTTLSPNAWVAKLTDSVSSAVSGALLAVNKLKETCRQVNSFVTAPVRLINQIASGLRQAAAAFQTLDDLLFRTPEELMIQPGAASSGASFIVACKARGDMRAVITDAMDVLCDLLDAIAQRKAREVSVKPGESLAAVAKRELGSADRWPAIASLNEIAGQTVPAATFVVQVPGA